jgi:hypothetical protein
MREIRLRALAGGVLALSLLLAPRVHGSPTAEDRAAADILFREGRALVKRGKYAEACPKIDASLRLDPTAGTLLALGDCYEFNGQTASAWATFNEARAMARKVDDKPRTREAARRAGLLETKLSKLIVEVGPKSRVEGLEVRRNGKPLDAVLFGSAIPVDPGEQVIEAAAPGKMPWKMRVIIEAKPGLSTVQVPALEDAPAPKAPAAAPADSGAERAAGSWSTQRTMGLLLGGLGVAGIAVGSVFGFQTLSKISQVRDQRACTDDDPPLCSPQGAQLHQDANTTANVSNVAFAAGGAALVAGVIVFVTAPSREAPKPAGLNVKLGPAVGVGTAGLSLRGSF